MSIIQVTKFKGKMVALSDSPEHNIATGSLIPDPLPDEVLLQVETCHPFVAVMLMRYFPLEDQGLRTFFEGGMV